MTTRGDAYELRARLRPFANNPRVRDCGLRPIGDPELVIADYGDSRRAWWSGVLQCGRQHSCPVCAQRKAASRADELRRMMLGDTGGRWVMVTITMRHNAGDGLAELLDRLFGAFRKLRSRRCIRNLFDAHVTATVRALEATHGKNGWHPHIHLLLRSDDWSPKERALFESEWVKLAGGDVGIAVKWSKPLCCWEDLASYLTKLGAELAGVSKEPKNGNRTPWQIADAVAGGCVDSRHLWAEYQRAMHGRRMLEMDERAKALLLAAAPKEEPAREWRVSLHAEEYRALGRMERVVPSIFAEMIEAAITGGPDPPSVVRSQLDDWLDFSVAA